MERHVGRQRQLLPRLGVRRGQLERFCLTAGLDALSRLMEQDAIELRGPRYGHSNGKNGQRWGRTCGKIGFHGGKASKERPQVRGRDGREMAPPNWEAAQSEDLLGRWAMNLMLINVSTRCFGRAVRLPDSDMPSSAGAGVSKSVVSRRFVAVRERSVAPERAGERG